MDFSINLGMWNSVFAVPSEIVDKHIKLVGAAQLKVLLWILRHCNENFSFDNIANDLSMNKADVKDSMQYWIETGVLNIDKNILSFNENDTSENQKQNSSNTKNNDNKPILKDKERILTRHEKPDSLSVAQRINTSSDIAFLMQEAQVILGRPISNSDSSTLLMLHDDDGLPIDIIIMILQYAVNIGKANMKYIEKVAISWANEEIDTIEKAEQKLRELDSHRKAWATVERIIGIPHRSPTAKEDEMSNRWINTWHVKEELIKEAFDRCINSKGRYISSYIDSIIKRWHNSNITTIAQAIEEDRSTRINKYSRDYQHKPSYSIEEYEKYSIFDD